MILGLIALFLYISYRKGKFDVSGFIYALVFWCLFLYAITELLSVGSLLNVVSLWIVWMMLDTVLIVLLIKNKAFKLLKESLHFDSRDSKYKFICAGLFILFALVIMYISSHVVPYNWDSLTYHLTRIFIWRQNQSVAHFATVGWRQVASPVLAEFVNTNVYIMFYPLFKANDGLFNILQSVSYLINIGFVYAISVKIGCKKRFGLFAAFLFACAPICFAEAMSTQVDQFATVWLLGFIYVVLEMIYDREKVNLNADGRMRMAVLGISAGFGYLAKPSVLIGMMIFAIWLIVVCFRRKDDTKLIVQWIVMTCLTAVLVMAPEIIRNLLTFHALSHKQVGAQQLVGTLDPRYLLVNCLKNTTFNLPYMYWPWLNSILSAIVYGTAAFLGINADALSISESGTPIVYHTEPDFGFDTAVNPLIVSLLIFEIGRASCRERV